jgi:methionyl-tRNA synthetase
MRIEREVKRLSEDIPEMIDEIFEKYDIENSIQIVEQLVQQMDKIIESDEMWENAMTDVSSRRVLAAAIGVVALKFADISDEMVDFLNNDE